MDSISSGKLPDETLQNPEPDDLEIGQYIPQYTRTTEPYAPAPGRAQPRLVDGCYLLRLPS